MPAFVFYKYSSNFSLLSAAKKTHGGKHPTRSPGGNADTGIQYIGSPSDFHASAEKIVVGVRDAGKHACIPRRLQ
jgi:hypothetical protein